MNRLPLFVLVVAAIIENTSASSSHPDLIKRNRGSNHCVYYNRNYRDQAIFTSLDTQCLTLRCIDGVVRHFNQACQIKGQCVNANQTLVHHCVTYKCRVSHQNNNPEDYMAQYYIESSECEDINGQCHPPNTQITRDNGYGRVFDHCYCVTTDGMEPSYVCP
ncbi:uncharacterized protein LOC131953538 [Physella acuta]|uniref:uncharacterized protein LOC131953538 n=1 Tax=Physella acuta TaxID=109671 RepID=UPI0027DCAF30|nr:uncharacterized protein LOC131953538 [Physella acuta]